jgi:hypothetical protein
VLDQPALAETGILLRQWCSQNLDGGMRTLRTSLSAIALSWVTLPIVGVASQSAPVTTSQGDDYLCYMQTSGGRTLDLSKLCQSSNKQMDAAAETGVVITEVKLSGTQFQGKVKNNTNSRVTSVVINYTVDAPGASNEDLAFTYVDQGLLEPRQEGTFQGELTRSGKLKILSVTWANSQ